MDTIPVDLSKLTEKEFKEFLDSFDHVFSDCDGVIWCMDIPLPGSGEFLKLMQKLGKTVHFVSNNSTKSNKFYDEDFARAGIENGTARLTVPSTAIAEYLKSQNITKKVYCVTCTETRRTLEAHGFNCVCGPDVAPEVIYEFAQFLQDDTDIEAVVFDSDYKFNVPKIYKSITYLKRSDVLFIFGATDKYVPYGLNVVAPGVGAFQDYVAKEVNREPTILGKPGKLFGEFAMKRAGVTDASRVLFIGDMVGQDVGLGKATGFNTLLVLKSYTKVTMMDDETLRPDYYAKSLGDLVPKLKEVVNGINKH